MGKLITDMEQVTPDWLTEVLREQGHLDRGKVVAVEKSPQSTFTSIVSHLKMTYSDDAPSSAPTRLFLKISDPDFRSNIYVSHKKEVDFYNIIAPAMTDPPFPRCYDALYSPETDQAHVLLEDLSETYLQTELSPLPPLVSHCEQAIDCLARVHAFWWEDPRLGKDIGALMDVQSFIQAFGMWLPGFLDFLGDRLFPHEHKLYERAVASLPGLWERHLQHRFAEGRGLTLIHTDLHFYNFLYPNDPTKDKPRIVDWESWSVYVGPTDLAYAIAYSWYPRRRRVLEKDLVKRYHDGLLKHGVEGYDWSDCWDDYRLAVFVNLFIPVVRWAMFDESRTGWWWNELMRALLAFEDLDCTELLD